MWREAPGCRDPWPAHHERPRGEGMKHWFVMRYAGLMLTVGCMSALGTILGLDLRERFVLAGMVMGMMMWAVAASKTIR